MRGASFIAVFVAALVGHSGDASAAAGSADPGGVAGSSLCGGILCDPRADCVGGTVCKCRGGLKGDGVSFCADVCDVGVAQRLNCFQDGTPSESMCLDRGCCWRPQSSANASDLATRRQDRRLLETAGEAESAVPPCFYHLPELMYVLEEVEREVRTLSGTLSCYSPLRGGRVVGRGAGGAGWFGSEVCPMRLEVSFDTKDSLRVRIFDPSTTRWEVPSYLFPGHKKGGWDFDEMAMELDYKVSYTASPFGLKVVRASTGAVLFDSTPVPGVINGLAFEEQVIDYDAPPTPLHTPRGGSPSASTSSKP